MKLSFHAFLPSLAALLLASTSGWAQPTYNYTRIQVKQALYQQEAGSSEWGINLDYLLYLPDGFSPQNEPYPVLFFLHGSGAKGSDLTKVSNLPPMLQAENGSRAFPYILIAPQALPNFRWRDESVQVELMTFFEEMISLYNIDRSRIYLTGQSMGGTGTWHLLNNYPDFFAAAAPICGGNDPLTAPALVNIPIWAFHGRLDQTIVPEFSIDMVNAITEAGGRQARLTLYEDIAHEVWWTVFKRDDIYDWFLMHQKEMPSPQMWDEFSADPQSFVNSGDYLGWLQVENDPWVWMFSTRTWVFYPGSHQVSTSGKWMYLSRF